MKNRNYPLYKTEPISNLKELVNHVADRYGNNPAFTFERNGKIIRISYFQFKSDVDALGAALFDLNVQNAKVAIIGENSYEWIVSYFATVNSGNVVVPLDREFSAVDIKALSDDSDAEVLIYANGFNSAAVYLRGNGANIRHYINMAELPEMLKRGSELIRHGDVKMTDYKINNNSLSAL